LAQSGEGSPTVPKAISNPREFWDRKAATFPRYSPGEDTYEASLLSLASENGASMRNAVALDVGCGTGMFTIRLAMEARKVIAVDISERMLDILREDARKARLRNIVAVNSDWLDFRVPVRPDIVFCSMSPAIGSEEGRGKLVGLAGSQVVAVVPTERFQSQIMAGLYDRYSVTPTYQREGPTLGAWLAGRGIRPTSVPVTGKWRVPQKLAHIKDSALCMLHNFGVEPDEGELDEYLEGFRGTDGMYLEITDYKLEMLLWHNP
jgi:SAM-dependent methyltransferase